jgi:hypothetical protein
VKIYASLELVATKQLARATKEVKRHFFLSIKRPERYSTKDCST